MNARARTLMCKALRIFFSIFYDRRYLTGRYFEERKIGWLWAFRGVWFQKVLGFNRSCPAPISPSVTVSNFDNLILGRNNINNLQSFGIYLQNYSAKIYIGDDCFIAPNVGVITANHNPSDLKSTLPGRDVIIGNNCWIGMNSVILPGVTLGDGVIVGAGFVVTKSFLEGHVVVAGNPARIKKYLKVSS